MALKHRSDIITCSECETEFQIVSREPADVGFCPVCGEEVPLVFDDDPDLDIDDEEEYDDLEDED